MAKKTKSNAQRAKKERITPRYLREGQSYTLGLHDVARALKVIEDKGHMKKFMRASKKKSTSVAIDAKSVNFVKDFMVDNNMHQHPIGKHIVNAMSAPGEDPFKPCNFGKD